MKPTAPLAYLTALIRDCGMVELRHHDRARWTTRWFDDPYALLEGACARVERSSPASSSISSWDCCFFLLFFGFGTGVISSEGRRDSMIALVGWPLRSSSQWRPG